MPLVVLRLLPVWLQMKPIMEALKEQKLRDLWMEFGFLALIVLYLVNMVRGSQINKRIAYAWAQEFATEGSILERNFSHVGICALRSLFLAPWLLFGLP